VKKAHLLVTNDDGIDAEGLIALVSRLHLEGHPVVVLAPQSEQSATGMKLTLSSGMSFNERKDIAESIRVKGGPPLRMFSLDGSPCDCVIVALEGGLKSWAPEINPMLCISGINHGPNLSVDVLHSGTVSAAREASLYGMPAIATSLATYKHRNFDDSLEVILALVSKCEKSLPKNLPNLLRPKGTGNKPSGNDEGSLLRSSFHHGDIFLNVNAPEKWSGSITTVSLGARWYRSASDMDQAPAKGIEFEVGAAKIVEEDIPRTDCNAINSGKASITPLGSWPSNHPLGISQRLLESSISESPDGLPYWI
jgi:5'/3'-nucleotidase SurE